MNIGTEIFWEILLTTPKLQIDKSSIRPAVSLRGQPVMAITMTRESPSLSGNLYHSIIYAAFPTVSYYTKEK